MYDDMSSDVLERRMLSHMPSDIDKREGSIAYDATAPAALELAEAYIMAQVILHQTFANTADREYLILRASEFNIVPYPATCAEVRGEFDRSVDIGARFSFGELYFRVTALLDNASHAYKLQCETAGLVGNSCIGNIIPDASIAGLSKAKITQLLVPGEEEEETEAFRQRFFETIKSQAYGGNGADYREKALAINGVGGVKVYRCWNGGGTVLLVILSSDYTVPTDELVKEVQDTFDPDPRGKGYGLAPIGHVVTTQAAEAVPITVSMSLLVKSGYATDDMLPRVKMAVDGYLKRLREDWCKQDDRESLYIRASVISSDVINITGIVDVTNITINDKVNRYALDSKQVPVLGTVTLNAG